MIELTEKELNALIDYLARRPYVEVYELVNMLTNKVKQEPEVKNTQK